MKRLLAILLALCMLAAMAGCGSNSSAGDNPPPATESDQITTTVPDDPVITEPTDESADITEVLPVIESEYGVAEVLTRFYAGRAWVKYEKDDRSTGYAIIDENGFIIASYDSTELGWGNYVSAANLDNGISCLYSSYHSISKSYPRTNGMIIVDENGSIIFNSESAAENTDYWYCGYGDGTILVVEYISDFSNNVAYICETNLQGEITDRTEIDTKRASYTYADFRYRGNDIFIGTTGYSLLSGVPYWIYNRNTNNLFRTTSSEEQHDFSTNGLMLYSDFSEGYALGGNGTGRMYQIPLESLLDENAWSSFAKEAEPVIKLNSSRIAGRAIAHETGIYDEYGQLIGTYPENWNVTSVNGFSGEYVAVTLRGADSNNYICVADKNGTPQYEPIRCNKYISSKNGYVLVEVGSEEKAYDLSGTEISRFEYLLLNSDSAIWAYDDAAESFIDSAGTKLEHIYAVSNYSDIAGEIYPYPYIEDVISEEVSPTSRSYITLDNFNIEGKWKNTGSYTFGQVQNGAIVVFNGTNCNFFSPNDTYAFYYDNGNYHLDCTSPLADTLSFIVKIIDENNIDIYNGTNHLALKKVE